MNISQVCPLIPQAIFSGYKSFNKYGLLKAASSGCHSQFRETFNARTGVGRATYTSNVSTPTVQVQYMPTRPSASVAVAGPSCVATDQAYDQPLTVSFAYNTAISVGKLVNITDFNRMCEGVNQASEAFIRGKKIDIPYAKSILASYGIDNIVMNQFAWDIENTIVKSAEQRIASALGANVGYNYATASTAVVNMTALQANGTPNPIFLNHMLRNENLAQECNGCIQVITGTGQAVADYMRALEFVCPCNAMSAFDYAEMIAKSPKFMWYTSTAIDSTYGANRVFVVFPNTIAYNTIFLHEAWHGKQHANTHYSKGAFTDFNCQDAPDQLLKFDFRMQEVDCGTGGNAYPTWKLFVDFQDVAIIKFLGMESQIAPNNQWTGIMAYNFS